MVKVIRLSLAAGQTYENVNIYLPHEQVGDIPNHFEDAQLVFRDNIDTYIVPIYQVRLIQLNKHNRRFPSDISYRYSHIALYGDLTFGPIWALSSADALNKANIPVFHEAYEQFTFACNDGTFVTTDFNVIQIKV